MRNVLNWFEIFVTDMARARAFYEKVLEVKLEAEDFGGMPNCMFPQEKGSFGALVKHPRRKPNPEGALVYLNCNGRLDQALSLVVKAGGEVVMPKLDIGDPGFIALVRDTEGNVVGLHSER